MEELLRHRWADRDRELNERFLAIQAEMNGRGILHSSIAVKALHEVVREEFETSRRIIVGSVIDCLRRKKFKLDRQLLDKQVKIHLADRRHQLDALFNQRMRVSFEGLQNEAMISSFTSLAQYFDHSSQELSIELTRALDDFELQLGANLKERVINSFLNNPLIVVGLVVMLVVIAILVFIDAVLKAGN